MDKFLCFESYDFLKAVLRYQERLEERHVAQQTAEFEALISLYLLPGSQYEVNISNSLRSTVLQHRAPASFAALPLMQRQVRACSL